MNKFGTILVVDDDPLVLDALNQTFLDEYDVISAASGQEAIDLLKNENSVDTIILDIKMARKDGLQTATEIKQINPEIPIIFHTGYPGEYSKEKIEKGYQPFDYIGKNEYPSRLTESVKNAVSFYKLKSSSAQLGKLARQDFGMVGKSKYMLDVFQTIEKIGPTENKVMILGPTGTGKELVARAIHRRSQRYHNPLVIFNCNQNNTDLVESELFGHVKGAFTGAVSDRLGIFETADKGTVFLDEIGDLDLRTQSKILGVIERKEMRRLGASEVIKVNVRLICATHHDLQQMVKEQKFREDLFYRLKGVTIKLPALKDRREDIPELIDFFNQRYCNLNKTSLKIFEPLARECLIDYDWPGNVRQILDTVQSLIDLTPSQFITKAEVLAYLTQEDEKDYSSIHTFKEQVREFKRKLVLKTLDHNNNNISASARVLSLDPSNLRKLIQDLGITHK